MTGAKKGITYRTSYKVLKNMITERLDKEYQFSTKKERKEAIKSVMGETRSAFKNGVAGYLNSNIDKCVHKFSPIDKVDKKSKPKANKKVKTIGALRSSTKK